MLQPGAPKGLAFEGLSLGPGKKLTLRARTAGRAARCPLCKTDSRRVHSFYERTISDLPLHGVAVSIAVRARRFFCDGASCERRIFCERLPDVAAHARNTGRLEEASIGGSPVRKALSRCRAGSPWEAPGESLDGLL